MTTTPGKAAARREARLSKLSAAAGPYGAIRFEGSVPFGPALSIECFRLENGLRVLFCQDRSAPVVAYHSWFRVGSRHERVGKTGLAHLFEHLMFNETENLPAGEFDRRLEQAGAESNAATWLDWTHYNVAVPRDQLSLVVRLEAERMARLVVRDPQVESEKEVVANERRFRVDDDVEGAIDELLWSTAFETHAYRWPTIGWMEDILAFSTTDCQDFYKTFYSPNNATLVVVGDVTEGTLLGHVAKAYGNIPPSSVPIEDVRPEPPQLEERRTEVTKPTATDKLAIGYHSPALGDFDHPALSLLSEVLFGGRASRVYRRLVRELELAVELSASVGPFRDPGLFEIYASARESHRAEELLAVIDEELDRAAREAVSEREIERARSRLELGLIASLETVDGKASTIGFYDTVLNRPGAAFERLEATNALGPSDLLRAARRYLRREQRTVVIARPHDSLPKAAQ